MVITVVLNPYLERQRLIIVCVTIFLNAAAACVFARLPWPGWRTGLALALADNALFLFHAFRMRDALMLRLMLFGLIVGFIGLAADAWLVDATGTLDYSAGGGPMLWRSPFWMPLVWQIMTVQFGYIGLRLYEAMGWPGLVVTGLAGSINIPFHEDLALHAHWWRFSQCRMLFHTPWFIILGEFFIAAIIGRLAACVRERSWGRLITAGVLGGVAILAGYSFAYLLTDHLWKTWH